MAQKCEGNHDLATGGNPTPYPLSNREGELWTDDMSVLRNYKPGVWVEPTDWIAQMRWMIEWLGDDDLKSSEALCVRAVGDFVAGHVLHRLLMWMPFGSRDDGFIWKSDRDLDAEMGTTYAQMKRARGKLKPFLTMKLKKAKGAPTWHYKVNAEALVRAIARVVLRSYAFVKAWFFTRVENGFSTISQIDFRQTRKTITTESTTQSQLLVSDLLIDAGVNKDAALKFGHLPREVVLEFIKKSETKLRPGGYVLGCCRNWEKQNLPHPQALQQKRTAAAPGNKAKMLDWADYAANSSFVDTPPPGPLPASGEGEQKLSEQRELDLRREEESPASKAWSAALHQLEVQLDRANFDTWLRGRTVFLALDLPGTFVIGVENVHVRDNCQLRLYRTIRRVLSDVWGAPVELRFEIVRIHYERGGINPPLTGVLVG